MNWLKRLFSRRRVYDDLSEEIQEHLEEKIEELVASGMSRRVGSSNSLHDVVPSAMSRRRKMRGRPSIDYLIGGKAMAAPGTHVGSSGKTEPPASNDKRWR